MFYIKLYAFILDRKDTYKKGCVMNQHYMKRLPESYHTPYYPFGNYDEYLHHELSGFADELGNELAKANETKELWKKIKQLEQNLHLNISDKKSACFWCTHDFDNPPIYIPKHYLIFVVVLNQRFSVDNCMFCRVPYYIRFLMI